MLLNVKKKVILGFAMENLGHIPFVPSKEEGVKFFEWDYNKFTSINSRWSSNAQIIKKKKNISANWNWNGAWMTHDQLNWQDITIK